MSLFPLDRLLTRLIKHGQLTVADTNGKKHTFGPAGSWPTVTMRIHDRRFPWRIVRRPGLVIGEAYMDGSYTLEDGTLQDFLEIVLFLQAGVRRKGSAARSLNEPAPSVATIPVARRGTSSTTTTLIIAFTNSSSTRTCNIPAPVGARA